MNSGRDASEKITSSFAPGMFTSVLRTIYFALVALLVVPLGSLDPRPLHLFGAAFFMLAIAIVMLRPVPRATRRLFVAATAIACLLAVWIVAQTLDIPGNPFANPIWAQAELFFGPMPRTISIAPGDSMEAIIPVLLPFAVCLAGLLLYSSDQSAERLLRLLCIFGGAVAVFGLIEFVFFPDQLLFEKKTAHLDGLTAVFVNRNTAATFLGVTVLVAMALAFGHLQKSGVRDFLRALAGTPSTMRSADRRWALIYLVVGSLAFVALMMTKSRAGIGSSFLGIAVLMGILVYGGTQSSRTQYGFARPGSLAWRRVGRVSVALLLLLAAGAIFARQALLRAEVQGTDDLRFCVMPGIIRLLGDNWLLGTGLGTFRDAFAPYFDPRCNINYVWNRAHNVYVEGWINLGLPFVILASATIAILFAVLVRGVAARRRMRFLPALGLGVLTVGLAHSALDFSLQIPGFAVFWAAVLTPCLVVASDRPGASTRPPSPRHSVELGENRTVD